jgi:hypothetical protein
MFAFFFAAPPSAFLFFFARATRRGLVVSEDDVLGADDFPLELAFFALRFLVARFLVATHLHLSRLRVRERGVPSSAGEVVGRKTMDSTRPTWKAQYPTRRALGDER